MGCHQPRPVVVGRITTPPIQYNADGKLNIQEKGTESRGKFEQKNKEALLRYTFIVLDCRNTFATGLKQCGDAI
jgi:hypothetical protein